MPETTRCASCGVVVSATDRFCPSCGTEQRGAPVGDAATVVAPTQATHCASCGAMVRAGQAYCPGCGAVLHDAPTVASQPSLERLTTDRLVEATTGEFEVLQRIGHGAMGSVYLARDVALSRRVAIKVISPQLLQDESMVARFRLEAQTVAALRHPNIVNLHAVKQLGDLHYFVMDFIDGPSLRAVMKAHAPLEIPVAQALLFQIGSALSYGHRRGRGVIHRDIKPANVMVDRDGHAVVMDFGISKVGAAQSGLTQTGATIGTPEYMSPEQCMDQELTGASDQYALGIVAYEMLTGAVPFKGSTYAIMMAHAQGTPPSIREQRSDCPPEIEAAVMRMLAKDPAARFADAAEAVGALGGVPLGHGDPVRERIIELVGSVSEVETDLDESSPLSPVPPPKAAGSGARPAAVHASGATGGARVPPPATTGGSDTAGPPPAGRTDTAVPERPGSGPRRAPAVALGALALVVVAGLGVAQMTRMRSGPDPSAPADPALTARSDVEPVEGGTPTEIGSGADATTEGGGTAQPSDGAGGAEQPSDGGGGVEQPSDAGGARVVSGDPDPGVSGGDTQPPTPGDQGAASGDDGGAAATVPPAVTTPVRPSPRPADESTAATVTEVRVSAPLAVREGHEQAVRAEAVGPSGAPVGGAEVVWSSSDPTVAAVRDGTLVSTRAGSVVLTAAAGGVTTPVELTVLALPTREELPSLLEAFVDPLRRANADEVRRRLGRAGRGERGRQVLARMREASYSARLAGLEEPVPSGPGGTVDFQVALEWRAADGERRREDVWFRGRLEPTPRGWEAGEVTRLAR